FRDASFDAVVCQLGLQFFPDPVRGVGEFRRVLRKDGRVGICVISTPDRAPMWGDLADVLSGFLPELRDILFLSFALHDPSRLEAMLVGAGFTFARSRGPVPRAGSVSTRRAELPRSPLPLPVLPRNQMARLSVPR